MAANDLFRPDFSVWRRTHAPHWLTRRGTLVGGAVLAMTAVSHTVALPAAKDRIEADLAKLAPAVNKTRQAGNRLQGVVRDGCVVIPAHFSTPPNSSELLALRQNPWQASRSIVATAERRVAASGSAFGTQSGRMAVQQALRQTAADTMQVRLPLQPHSAANALVGQTYAEHLDVNVQTVAHSKAEDVDRALRAFRAGQDEFLARRVAGIVSYNWLDQQSYFKNERAASVGLDETFGRPQNPNGFTPPLTLPEAVMNLPDSAIANCPKGF